MKKLSLFFLTSFVGNFISGAEAFFKVAEENKQEAAAALLLLTATGQNQPRKTFEEIPNLVSKHQPRTFRPVILMTQKRSVVQASFQEEQPQTAMPKLSRIQFSNGTFQSEEALSSKTFKCSKCTDIFPTSRGLGIHFTAKHRPLFRITQKDMPSFLDKPLASLPKQVYQNMTVDSYERETE